MFRFVFLFLILPVILLVLFGVAADLAQPVVEVVKDALNVDTGWATELTNFEMDSIDAHFDSIGR